VPSLKCKPSPTSGQKRPPADRQPQRLHHAWIHPRTTRAAGSMGSMADVTRRCVQAGSRAVAPSFRKGQSKSTWLWRFGRQSISNRSKHDS